jgi:hypothetical protein
MRQFPLFNLVTVAVHIVTTVLPQFESHIKHYMSIVFSKSKEA